VNSVEKQIKVCSFNIFFNLFEGFQQSQLPQRPQTPEQTTLNSLVHTPPPHSPDSDGLTPSTRRSLPRQRVEPISPTSSHYHLQHYPSPLINNRPRRETIRLPARYRSPEIPYIEQLKLCTRNPHQKPRQQFIDSSSNKEFDTCNQCRQEISLEVRTRRQRLRELEDELEQILAENLEINEDESQGKYLT
jgi:hypothetical protein